MTVSVEFHLFPKQSEFFDSDAPEKCYSGGFGAGKTLTLCLDLLRHVHGNPRETAILARAKLTDLIDTVLPVLLEGTGDTPPVLTPGTYIYRASQRTIRLLGGGKILLAGIGSKMQDDLNRMGVRGHTVTRLYIDQAEEISEKQYLNARGRIRAAGAKLSRQTVISANPGPPSHWIARRFGITGDKAQPGTFVVQTSAFDNPNLPPDYIALLKSYTGVMYQRYVLGRWVASDNQVYPGFNRDIHMRAREIPGARRFAFIDDGTTNPAAIYLVLVDADNRAHLAREVHQSGLLNSAKVRYLKDFGQLEAVIVDPAAASLKAELRSAGMAVIDGDNDVIPGIQDVQQALEPGPDGEPGLTADPSCTKFRDEMESYEWDANAKGEKVVKKNDHAPDAVRYGIRHIKRPRAMVFDMQALAAAETRARTVQFRTFHLTHQRKAGVPQDMAIQDRRRREVGIEPAEGGSLTAWTDIREPLTSTDYSIFASPGDGGIPSVATVANNKTGQIVAQYVKALPPERFARAVAMLSLWFTGKHDVASVGYHASPAGLAFGQALEELGAAVSLVWKPDPREFAEAVGVLRAAWDTGQLVEPDPLAFVDARQYIWANQTVMHVSMAKETERRGSHADRVIARAGLWIMLQGVEAEAPEPRLAHPASPEARRRKREEEKREGQRWVG